MNAVNIKLYNLLKNDLHLADAKAEEFVQALDDLFEAEVKNSATEYRSVVKEDLLRLDSKMEITASNLREEIKEAKVDTIKWMFGIFLALALLIIGLYIKPGRS
jgi:hypothetical protein